MFHTLRFSLLKLSSLILLLSLSLYSYTISNEEVQAALFCNELVVNCQFDEADRYTDSLLAASPDKPLYYYLSLASIGLRSLDSDVFSKEKKFLKIFKKGNALIKSLEIKNRSSDLLLVKGFLKASYFSYMMVGGKYMAALNDGKGALDIIEEAKKLNPSNYDADYFIGFYSFAKGELRNRLKLLLFWMPDGVKNGGKSLSTCVAKSRFMGSAANMVRVDVYVRDKKYSKAKPLLDSLMGVYPQSRFLMWTEARYYEGKKQWVNGARVYEKLSNAYMQDSFYHNALVTADEAIKLYKKTKRIDLAILLSKEIKRSFPLSKLHKSDKGLYKAVVHLAKKG